MDTQKLVDEIMNEVEQAKLIAFKEDRVMFDAVKKFILYHIFSEGTARKGHPIQADRNWALSLAFSSINPQGIPRSDEELGSDLRAFVKGINTVESGFKELETLTKKETPEENKENPAL